jgi:heme-degrading monooxygenase HmoA
VFVVAFEVEPHADLWDEYLQVAATLRPQLESIDGFIDNTRFRCARAPRRLLSLSTWRDEKALIRWRTQAAHHELGQQRGRSEIFSDYRLRVAEVTVDNQPPAGSSLRQSRYDETETGTAKAITLIEPLVASPPDALPVIGDRDGLINAERYDAVLPPHHPILLLSWTTLVRAQQGTPIAPHFRVRHCRVIRDYGRKDRREAPQYFPPVA